MNANSSCREIRSTSPRRSATPNRFSRSTTSRRSVYGEPVAQPHPSLWMSIAKAACFRRNAPPRRSSIPAVHTGPRIVPATSGISAQVSRYAWSIRLRPTSPLELGSPEASISRAFSTALAASTNMRPRAVPGRVLGRRGVRVCLVLDVAHPPGAGSMTTVDATVCGSRSTRPVASAFASVLRASYLAWTGQIGTQLMLP